MVYDSEFRDIFDEDYFISSLRDEVEILKELPPAKRRKVASGGHLSMAPVSWSNMSYYYTTVRLQNFCQWKPVFCIFLVSAPRKSYI